MTSASTLITDQHKKRKKTSQAKRITRAIIPFIKNIQNMTIENIT